MTIASLYNFKQRPTLGAIEVNVSIREVYTLQADMPSVPVERGSDLTDHRRTKPETFAIDGWISGAALRSRAQVNEQGEVIRRPVNGEGVEGLTVAEAYAQLFEVFNQKEPFDVVTNLRSYKDMHFVSLTITRDAQTSEVIAFSATLQQIQFAEAQTGTVRVVRSAEPKAAPKKKLGKKAPEAEADPNRSTLRKIANKFSKSPGKSLRALLGG